jgi:hypothetical protein
MVSELIARNSARTRWGNFDQLFVPIYGICPYNKEQA